MVTATFAYDDDEEGYCDSQHLWMYSEDTARSCMMAMGMVLYTRLTNMHASTRATCCCSEDLAFKLPPGTSEIAYREEGWLPLYAVGRSGLRDGLDRVRGLHESTQPSRPSVVTALPQQWPAMAGQDLCDTGH